MGWRIQCWYAAILVIVVSGLLVAVDHIELERRVMLLDLEAEALIQHMLPELSPRGQAGRPAGGGPPRGPGGAYGAGNRRPPPRKGGGPLVDSDAGAKRERYRAIYEEQVERGAFVVVWNDDESVLYQKGEVPAGLEYREAQMQPSREPFGAYRTVWRAGPRRRTIVAGIPRHLLDESMREFRTHLVIYGVAIVSVVMLVGLIVVRRALRPVKEISETAEDISQGDLSRRIDVADGCSELASLGGVLNGCFSRLEENFVQQQRFTADASHELRTPVSVLLTTSQRMLAHERNSEEYREAFQVCERSAMRMKRLVDELTELARFDSGEVQLALEDEDLAILADCIATDLKPIAAERDITIELDLQPAPCRIDSIRIEQVVANLVMNAIRHNPESIEITLRTWSEGGESFLEVRDKGKGIAEEDQRHLFDRFYQVGHALSRSSGGSGLGLAICKAIAERHDGRIDLTSKVGQGSAFRLTLPVGRSD